MRSITLRHGDEYDYTYKYLDKEKRGHRLVTNLETKQQFWIFLHNTKTKEEFRERQELLCTLNHPHIPKLIACQEKGMCKRERRVEPVKYFITEAFSHTSMANIIKAAGDGIQGNIAKFYFLQLCELLSYLHCQNKYLIIDHPQKIAFTKGWNIKVRNIISDISCSYKWHSSSSSSQLKIQRLEALLHTGGFLSAPRDVHALAKLVWRMWLNQQFTIEGTSSDDHLIEHNQIDQLFDSILKRGSVEYIPDELKEMLVLMLQKEPVLRPSIAELK